MTLPAKSTDPALQQALGDLQRLAETINMGMLTLTRHPFTTEIPDRGLRLADVSGTIRLYTRNGSTRYYVDMTAV